MSCTGLVIVAFNRPAVLAKMLEIVGAYWDGPVFAQVDAPREGHPEDSEAVDASVQAIQRLLAGDKLELWSPDRNLGVSRAVPAALDRAFESCDRLIVLEDDCLPHPDFFSFMPAMLDRYAGDPRVMHINGNTYGEDFSAYGSYTFGRLAQVWGWGTWRRAWQHYEHVVSDDLAARQYVVSSLPLHRQHRLELLRRWSIAVDPRSDHTWDYQWQYAVARRGSCVVVPRHNLISNIGFGPDASHTRTQTDYRSHISYEGMPGPYDAPHSVHDVDAVTQRYAHHMLGSPSAAVAFARRVRRALRALPGKRR